MGGGVQPTPVVVGVQLGMTMPFGANQAMKRRGGLHVAAPARRVHSADGKNGSAMVAPPPLRNNRRDGCLLMFVSFARAAQDTREGVMVKTQSRLRTKGSS